MTIATQITPQNKPKVLLFDLGGVIVPWVGIEALAEISNLTRAGILKIFQENSVFFAYETGQCDDDTFITELKQIFGLEGSQETLKTLWQSWVKPPYPNTVSALQTLKSDYIVSCLSNTNALHWARLKMLIDLDDCFDPAFASHEIFAAKPDPKSFMIPVECLDVPPKDIWFFDDTEVNVKAAQDLGMQAFHVDRSVGVIPTLISLGLLKPQ